VALNVDGAAVALTARGDDLADLCTSAGRVREAGLPLPFVHQSSPPYLARAARPGPTHRDNRAVHALARIMLHGRISNIQTSWVKLGVERTQIMLQGGANDLGGTLMEETISRMAGSEHGSVKTVQELVEIAAGIGRPARQRTTTYAETPPKPERPLRPVCGQRR
jgi:2-iminoacetate synthase ThiH